MSGVMDAIAETSSKFVSNFELLGPLPDDDLSETF